MLRPSCMKELLRELFKISSSQGPTADQWNPVSWVGTQAPVLVKTPRQFLRVSRAENRAPRP